MKILPAVTMNFSQVFKILADAVISLSLFFHLHLFIFVPFLCSDTTLLLFIEEMRVNCLPRGISSYGRLPENLPWDI